MEQGRVAVVTGARQGLGRAVAEHLAGQGYALALLDVAEQAEPACGLAVTVDVNLAGPFLLCRAFGRGMLERRGGSIVNVASIAGLRGVVGHVPMARFASPADVARAVAFLADDEASGFVNGQELGVDGGWHADGSWQSLRLRKR